MVWRGRRGLLSFRCHLHATAKRRRIKIQFHEGTWATSRVSTCTWSCPAPGPGPAWRPRCERRCAAAGWRRARGCPLRGRWPQTWASPGTPSPTPTASSSPRAGWPRGTAPARWVAERAPRRPPARPPPGQAARGARYDLRPGRPMSGVPAPGLARGGPPGAGRGAVPKPSATPTRAAGSCAGRWPSTSARPAASGHARPHRRLRGLRPGAGLLCQACASRGVTDARGRGATAMPSHRGRELRPTGCHRRRCPVDEPRAPGGRAGSATPGAVLLTPAHQFPLGVALAPARRREVVDWAAGQRRAGHRGRLRRRVPLRPAGRRRTAVARPRPRRLCRHREQEPGPGLRLGWLALPGELVDEVGRAQGADRPAEQQPRPADAGRVHQLRRLRPPGTAGPARLPPAPRPAGRRAGPRRARCPGHRDRGRPARAA